MTTKRPSCVPVNDLHIRPARGADAAHINRIANGYIANTAVNFDTEVWTLTARRRWLNAFNQPSSPYTMLVGLLCEALVGFAYNTPFRPKPAYNSSTETTIYLDPAHQTNGYGEKLYTALLATVAPRFHRAYAIIAQPNPASLSLHEKLGFRQVGILDEIGNKFGHYHSIALYQKKL